MLLNKFITYLVHRVAVFLLFSGALLPGFSSQLNKLPSLVNHYRHHLQEHGYLSVGDFIFLHYVNDSGHLEEENHQDLPFFQMSVSSLVAVAQEFPTFALTAPVLGKMEQGIYRPGNYSFEEAGGIFQPPKLA